MLTDAEVILRLERMQENMAGARNQEMRRDRYALKRAIQAMKSPPPRRLPPEAWKLRPNHDLGSETLGDPDA